MNLEERKGILRFPKATFERLKLYHALLSQLLIEGKQYVLSEEIAEMLRITPEQVRKDFSFLETKGKPKVGYVIKELLNELDELFGTGVDENIIIIGAGHLGSALANYKGFKNIGIRVAAIFDNDPNKIGTMVGELMVLPLKDLSRVIRRFRVKIAAICVPENAAQQVADLLVSHGIKALWNFSTRILDVPEDIIVQNEDITRGLLGLKHMLAEKERIEAESVNKKQNLTSK
ncbi:redox-sensing transcriptional repressor Rex [Fervidobacterium pennivorans subsp. shakshaketiis]|jgi:redox-sensing transcriptional repressor|uniref:Redox-sensing transcriptional repressor Rex n=1 Tax=Fervidobacterium pennivorans (strain DSM 9078 / Ven5) TaxID=771875 RepID=H9UBT4_FERPD|nr:redox-sensing transcriptional repressor Rex [Fervidobacterium pennivorans]AFG34977.1 AT-rich DNA-binding protein [Fervidobacterium pennivorans DSM 9078]QIV78129.1 redox-sensing transcriptional repressor Rex [Fervidobacterium pennivorans subsp. keratinolyticus]